MTTSTSNLSISVVSPPPPPTTNTLEPAQRIRLMKSTRKLGKVLGTTPFVLETTSPVSPVSPTSAKFNGHIEESTITTAGAALKRTMSSLSTMSSVSSASTASTSTSASSTTTMTLTKGGYSNKNASSPVYTSEVNSSAPRAAGLPIPGSERYDSPHPPVLLLHCVASSSPTTTTGVSRAKSASGSSNGTANSELTITVPSLGLPRARSGSTTSTAAEGANADATDLEDFEHDMRLMRMRKMNKLQRQLGEVIPAELVFGPSVSSYPPRTSSSSSSPTSRSLECSFGTDATPVSFAYASKSSLKRTPSSSTHVSIVSRSGGGVAVPRISSSSAGSHTTASFNATTTIPEYGEFELGHGVPAVSLDEKEVYDDVVRRLRALKA